jgi:tight adherence protein B
MTSHLLIVLIAAAVACLAWGVTSAIAVSSRGDRKKLNERLSTQAGGGGDPLADVAKSVTVRMADEHLPPALAGSAAMRKLNRALAQAMPDLPLARFLWIVAAAVFFPGLLAWAMSDTLFVGVAAAAAGGYAPFLVLTARRSKRQQTLADQLPEALDFLSRVLRAGHSLTTGLQMLGQELPEPLAGEFRRAYDEHSLGHPLDEALKAAVVRIQSPDFAFFVTATLIQRQTGGDLSEVLNNISGMIRQRVRLQQHVKAKTAEGRFTGYILVAFPLVMFVLSYSLNPAYTGTLVRTNTGLVLMAIAVGLQLMGLVAIKKITTVKV